MAIPASKENSKRESPPNHKRILKLFALPFIRIKQIKPIAIFNIHNPKISQKPINLKMLKNSVMAYTRNPHTREADKKELRQQELFRDF
jgi:hypothetical protein